ncbi:ABC transporter permease [Lewinella sp. LCG006]|uniref:ABC transporter permease n=1 Tax=Lewinella sp. LCG006 TaxID=3231911 RepID=UPI0034614190
MLFTMAWRNIWRNKRRTFITLASVAFAVFFAAFMQSIQKGAWDHMLDNVVNFYFGYAQVQKAGYWEEQSLDEALMWTPELEQKILETEGVQQVAPRLESFALAAGADLTTGVLVVGVSPEAENQLTTLADRVVEGHYWPAQAQGALVATGVMERLGLGLQDTIILLSQGYHGVNAAGKYPITGVLKFGSPDLNKRMVYLPRQEAEQFFGAEGMATTLALDIDHKEQVPGIIQQLDSSLDTSQFAILGWEQMIPDLVDAKELDAAGNNLVLIVLYLIISFGIFGTILMMTRERSYEFGVLTGIGMHRWQLGLTVWLEIILLGFLGTIVGICLSLPLVYYLKLNPIDLSVMGEEAVQTYEKFGMEPILPALLDPAIFLWQAVIVFSITTILALYPWWKISQLQPIAAMREG